MAFSLAFSSYPLAPAESFSTPSRLVTLETLPTMPEPARAICQVSLGSYARKPRSTCILVGVQCHTSRLEGVFQHLRDLIGVADHIFAILAQDLLLHIANEVETEELTRTFAKYSIS